MMKLCTAAAIPLAMIAAPLAAQAGQSPPPQAPALAPSEIVAAAPAADWTAIPASDLLVMTLAPDPRGGAGRTGERRVIIQLMPPPFSEGWVANIRTLAAAHWWDGLSINRVQDNYVVQWGDADGEDAGRARALPPGLRVEGEAGYIAPLPSDVFRFRITASARERNEQAAIQGEALADEADAIARGETNGSMIYIAPRYLLRHDSYDVGTSIWRGWPIGDDGLSRIWPVHCYGMVGVGRGLSPDTGTGAELYAVIGHAPRHLDRNIALVGRVIEGIEHLSSLPRGTEALGFYATPEERTGIVSIRLASELPAAEQPRFEYLSTESASFARYADARANRRDAFFIMPAGGADICNIPVPVRRVAG